MRPKCLLSGWTFVCNKAAGTLGGLVPNAGFQCFQVAIWSLPRGSMHSWAGTKSSSIVSIVPKSCNSSTFNSHPKLLGQPHVMLTSPNLQFHVDQQHRAMRLQQVEVPTMQLLSALDHLRRVRAAAQHIPGPPGGGGRHWDDAPGPELP